MRLARPGPLARRRLVARLGPLALVLALASACSSLRVASDWDHAYDFTALRTYSWARTQESDAQGPLVFLDRRIRRAVDDELAARGYRPVESGGDFLMLYTAKVRDRVDVTRWGGRWWGSTTVDRYQQGTLMLGVVDRARDEIVWTGWAEGIVSEESPSEEDVREAVAKILKGFPPA
jgi:hypothetical protein